MDLNPYESSDAPIVVSRSRRSRSIYRLASFGVLVCWAIAISAFFLFANPTIEHGEILMQRTGEIVSTSPVEDPVISTHFFSLKIVGATTVLAVLIALSLACVNGLIALFRRFDRQG